MMHPIKRSYLELTDIIEDAAQRGTLLFDLQQKYPEKLLDSQMIPFNKNGNLLAKPSEKFIQLYNKAARKWHKVPNPLWMPPKKNTTFVDAIRILKIISGKARKGSLVLTRSNGQLTYMSFAQYREITDKFVNGWLIGNFAHRKYYGRYEIVLLEDLWGV